VKINKAHLIIITVVSMATIIAIAMAANFVASPNDLAKLTPTPALSTSPTPIASNSNGPTPIASPKTNESATITFDVPVQIFGTGFKSELTQDTFYNCYAYFAWTPPPYVRYYEVSINYHGNTKPYQNLWSTGDFRLWGTGDDQLFPFSNAYSDNRTYVIGPSSFEDEFGSSYKGQWNNSGTWGSRDSAGALIHGPLIWSADKHGLMVAGTMTVFNSKENLSSEQIAKSESEMQQWLTDFTQGWVLTVKNIS
jgi:hypothetical protein